jgi:hypothetical protein
VALTLTGCFTMRADLPGTLRGDVAEPELVVLAPFSVEHTQYYALNGLVGRPAADVFAAEVRRQVSRRGADGVAHLVYESTHTVGDVAIGLCTFGCLAPRTYRLTGDVVRIRKQRLPGRPAKLVDAGGGRLAQRF